MDTSTPNGVNGVNGDHSPAHVADDDDGKPPPAKRPRVHSDPDQASLAHSPTPPPPSATVSTVVPPPSAPATAIATGPSTLTVAQYKFCQSTIRSLKKLKDSAPFLKPVDPVALNIPHYLSIIKNPMDFSTIERKLTASNPAKPDPNVYNPRYHSAEEFIADVRLVISNCVTFNGPDHPITAMASRVEQIFDKQIKNLPTLEPPVVKKQASPPPPQAAASPPAPAPPKKVPPVRRPSASVPAVRRTEAEPQPVGRPKREIHPPAPKDLPYADAPKKPRKGRQPKDRGTAEQLKYCSKILSDLHKKQHYQIANPFYEPVGEFSTAYLLLFFPHKPVSDWVKLEIPSYPKIIKKPMDLATMRRKIDAHEYHTATSFYEDFKLMIRNCFTFNPAGTPVN
jgi:hypothetical protein